jgi:hypothetical protein
MSGRFAGSKSLDERRRRRIAADEAQQPTPPAEPLAEAEKPLPARRPTGRFPLRRLVSRSPWKLACVGALALLASLLAVGAGHAPAVQRGTYGPGVATFCSMDSGRLTETVAGFLLIVTGQLAWLIRWARARSLRDFRGGYRIWWWASVAFFVAGVSTLSEAHVAFATTLVWLAGPPPFGSDLLYQLLPAAAALLLLCPALQRDMRGCRASRPLLFLAAGLWLAGGGAMLASERVTELLQPFDIAPRPEALTTGLLLCGVAVAFSSLLFHTRYVVYESVEPPEQSVRPKSVRPKKVEQAARETEPSSDLKAKRSSNTKRRKAEKSSPAPSETPAAPSAPSKRAAAAAAAEAAAVPEVAETETRAIQNEEPPVMQPLEPEGDDFSEQASADDWGDGQHYRLDGPEDPLRGLSKRERRRLRKQMKGRS